MDLNLLGQIVLALVVCAFIVFAFASIKRDQRVIEVGQVWRTSDRYGVVSSYTIVWVSPTQTLLHVRQTCGNDKDVQTWWSEEVVDFRQRIETERLVRVL